MTVLQERLKMTVTRSKTTVTLDSNWLLFFYSGIQIMDSLGFKYTRRGPFGLPSCKACTKVYPVERLVRRFTRLHDGDVL